MSEWRKKCFELYRALDDVDTASDIAKGDDQLYRGLVNKAHKRRFEVVSKVETDALYDAFYPKETTDD